MKQSRVFDGFIIILALTILIVPYVFTYKIDGILLNSAMGISLLSTVFVTNKKVKIFIAVFCLLMVLASYLYMK